MFYEKFRLLCFKAGIAETRACRDMGIAPNFPKQWKAKPDEVPSMKILKKVADYFNVDVVYFIKEEKEPEEKVPAMNVGNDMDSMFVELSRLYDRMNIKQRNKLLTAAYDIAGEND